MSELETFLRQALKDKIDGLTYPEVEVVDDFVDAVSTQIPSDVPPGSWLATPTWVDGFVTRLRAHHALSQEPLSTTQFEAAFNKASEIDGWNVDPAASATHRFFDTTLRRGGVTKRLSLKASSARDMALNSVHISKLTEAAWIQDARRQTDRRDELVRLFTEYQRTTDAIIMLRGFRRPASVRYELVEIPTTIFASVGSLSLADAQLATIPMPPGASEPDFKIRVDRSDAKITLTGIRLGVCTVHGRWELAGDKL